MPSVSGAERAAREARVIADRFACEARPYLRRGGAIGVEALLNSGALRLAGAPDEVSAELSAMRKRAPWWLRLLSAVRKAEALLRGRPS
jgi:hypothetical protein